jgi:hypothetical protein
MVRLDGSHHDCFEARRAPCVLMVIVDDATNCVGARFSEEEITRASYDVVELILANSPLDAHQPMPRNLDDVRRWEQEPQEVSNLGPDSFSMFPKSTLTAECSPQEHRRKLFAVLSSLMRRPSIGRKSRNICGDRVREARTAGKAPLTQDQLAGKLAAKGVSLDRVAIAKVECGLRCVYDFEVRALAEVLRVEVGWLLGIGKQARPAKARPQS